MIIQVRGTSGSGKSWVVRQVMASLGRWYASHVPGRRRPLYYLTNACPGLVIPGHYETPTGGCDTIGSARQVYDLITSLWGGRGGRCVRVLCEGLLLSEDTKWTLQLVEDGWDVRCLFLNTPLNICLSNVNARRAAAGNHQPVDPHNTTNRVIVIERARRKLLGRGIIAYKCPGEAAPGLVMRLLDVLGYTNHGEDADHRDRRTRPGEGIGTGPGAGAGRPGLRHSPAGRPRP